MKRVEENTALRESINGLEMVVSLSGYAVLDHSWYGNDICTPFNKLYLIGNRHHEAGNGLFRSNQDQPLLQL